MCLTKALHGVAVMSKIKKALRYKMGITLVRLQWQASLLDLTVHVKKQINNEGMYSLWRAADGKSSFFSIV